jgi:hypothetical protein
MKNAVIKMSPLQIKMFRQAEVQSPANRSTRLSSTVRSATLYDFAVTLKHTIW